MEQKPESARNQGGRRSNSSIITSSQKNKNVTAWPFNASPDLIPLTSDSSSLEDCFLVACIYASASFNATVQIVAKALAKTEVE